MSPKNCSLALDEVKQEEILVYPEPQLTLVVNKAGAYHLDSFLNKMPSPPIVEQISGRITVSF